MPGHRLTRAGAVAAGCLLVLAGGPTVSAGALVDDVVDGWAGSLGSGAPVRGPVPLLDRRPSPTEPAWRWPLPGPQVVGRHFDPPAQRWLPGHRGVDLPAATGSTVGAVDVGVVHFSGVVAGTGVVSVRHRDGLLSTYQPVADRVPRGRLVARGDRLGTLAPGGHCLLLTCLHLGARRGEVYLDPLLLLRTWEVSLLPFGDRR